VETSAPLKLALFKFDKPPAGGVPPCTVSLGASAFYTFWFAKYFIKLFIYQ